MSSLGTAPAPLRRRLLTLCLALCALAPALLILASSQAQALEPWWHLTSGTRPAYLREGAGEAGANETQKVTVAATGGRFVLANMTKEEVEEGKYFCFLGPEEEEEIPKFAEFEFNATSGEVQEGLEHVCGYGAGNVDGPANASPPRPAHMALVSGSRRPKTNDRIPTSLTFLARGVIS